MFYNQIQPKLNPNPNLTKPLRVDSSPRRIELPQVGELIDAHYQVLYQVSHSRHTAVFKAQELQGRDVAVKMLRPQALSHPEAKERFIRGGQLLMLVSHPNVVQIYDSGTHNGLPYLVMEFLRGESLSCCIKRYNCVTVGATLTLLAQILDGLYQTHRVGAIHGNLTPENIFQVYPNGGSWKIKILDYGLGKALRRYPINAKSRSLAHMGTAGDTPGYTSPEMICGLDKATPSSDIYAVGCIAYHLLTGRPPFSGTPMEVFRVQMNNPLPRLPQPLQGHPIESLIHRAIAPDPKDRFADVVAMLQTTLDLLARPSIQNLNVRAF